MTVTSTVPDPAGEVAVICVSLSTFIDVGSGAAEVDLRSSGEAATGDGDRIATCCRTAGGVDAGDRWAGRIVGELIGCAGGRGSCLA